jgi:hypothetical protein
MDDEITTFRSDPGLFRFCFEADNIEGNAANSF